MIPLNTPVSLSFVGDGTEQIVFPISFPTFEIANIEAQIVTPTGVVVDLILDQHYNVDNIGIPNTDATLNLYLSSLFEWTEPYGLKQNYTLNIKFSSNAFQPAKLRDLGRFAPEVLEKVVDRLTMNVLALRQKTVEIAEQFQEFKEEVEDQISAQALALSDLQVEVEAQQDLIDETKIQVDEIDVTLTDHESRLSALEATSTDPSLMQLEVKSSSFSAQFNKVYVIDSSDPINVFLPAPEANKVLYVKRIGSGVVTLIQNGSESIDGISSNKNLTSTKESVTLISNGVDWFII